MCVYIYIVMNVIFFYYAYICASLYFFLLHGVIFILCGSVAVILDKVVSNMDLAIVSRLLTCKITCGNVADESIVLAKHTWSKVCSLISEEGLRVHNLLSFN